MQSAARPKWVTIGAVLILTAAAFLAVFSEAPAGLDPSGCSLQQSLVPPSFPGHIFGYDLQGCDLLVLTMAGTRNSLLVGVLATLFALAVAIPAGTTAGFAGGWFDGLVGRLVDLVTALPIILIGLVILSGLDDRGVLLVAIVMAVAAWPIYTRVIRAATSRESELAHVDAARALGAGRSRLLIRHVMPGSIGSVIAVIPATIAFTIGAEALLSFLGAGLQLPDVSWGVLLAEAQRYIRQAPHLMLPGVFLLIVTGALVVLGEAARVRLPD
jgi:ABC-type dipeptide/oligopeptide/nickel transport system permease subunit